MHRCKQLLFWAIVMLVAVDYLLNVEISWVNDCRDERRECCRSVVVNLVLRVIHVWMRSSHLIWSKHSPHYRICYTQISSQMGETVGYLGWSLSIRKDKLKAVFKRKQWSKKRAITIHWIFQSALLLECLDVTYNLWVSVLVKHSAIGWVITWLLLLALCCVEEIVIESITSIEPLVNIEADQMID